MPIKKKDIDLVKLAELGGQDLELFLLDKINKAEEEFKQKIDNIKNDIGKIKPEVQKAIEQVKLKKGDKGDDGIDGKDADEEKIVKEVIKQIPKPIDGENGRDGKNGKDGETPVINTTEIAENASKLISKELLPLIPKIDDIKQDLPRMSEDIRNALELLQGEERLDFSAIKGLRGALNKLRERPRLGGGGGLSKIALEMKFIDNETPSGLINGINKVFTIKNIPNPPESLKVYIGGVRMRLTEDYTLSKRTITFLVAPMTNEIILCDYRV